MTNNKVSQDPKVILQTAVEKLDLFIQSTHDCLEVGEDGQLVIAKQTRLERIMKLAEGYISSLVSHSRRQKQENKIKHLKQMILEARDAIQSHVPLIKKFEEEGDESQRKLAHYALATIQRYNAFITLDDSKTNAYDVYNYERNQLLRDQEIQGQLIQLPYTISIKYNSHPIPAAHQMIKELSQVFLFAPMKKTNPMMSSTHKKALQSMIDTFHVKSIRLMQLHLSEQNSMSEIVKLVKQTPLEIDEESQPHLTNMRQIIELDSGFFILVTGSFNRHLTDPKLMALPVLDSFRLNFQFTHSGFPYPAQHTGWSLSDRWIEAYPLRIEQVPLYQAVNQRKKTLNQKLLFDRPFMQKVRTYHQLKREVFDQNRHLFIPLHRQFQELLHQNLADKKDNQIIFDTFYKQVEQASSAFDILTQTQQQLLELFINQPIKALEEEWLSYASTPLRTGSQQEIFHAACHQLSSLHLQAENKLEKDKPEHMYILQQGKILAKAFQSIGLQYQSEKMKFSPPLLSDFERKLQISAFQQQLTFIQMCENDLVITDKEAIKQRLIDRWNEDLKIMQPSYEEENSLPVQIINELEFYFNSRFSAFQASETIS